MSRTLDPQKNTAIVREAKALFLESGYERTSMEAIARSAGVSKPTLYRHFADKSELFREVIRHVGAWVDQQWPVPTTLASAEKNLMAFAEALHAIVFQRNALAFLRLVIQEANRDPVVGLEYARLVDEPMTRAASRIIDQAVDVQKYPRENAGETFLSLLREPWLTRALTSGEMPTKAQLKAARRNGVRQFCRLYEVR